MHARLPILLLLVVLGATGLCLKFHRATSWTNVVRHAETDESDPPPPGVREAEFGGESVKAAQAGTPTVVVAASATPTWQELGPLRMTEPGRTAAFYPSQGRMNCIAVDPQNPQHLYAGSAGGGVWVTTDGGATWSPRAQTLPIITTSSIVVDPNNGNIVYLATGDADGSVTPSAGVYKSTDGGTTWQATGLTFDLTAFRLIFKLAINPTDGANVYAAGNFGVAYTRDGGATWTTTTPAGPPTPRPPFYVYNDIKLQPGTPSTIYTSVDNGAVYRSTNSGATWTLATGVYSSTTSRAVLGVTPANSSLVFELVAASSTDLQLFKSTDGGATFSQIPSATLKAQAAWQATFYDLALSVSPTNADELIGGAVNVFRSTDGGATWVVTSNGPGDPIVHVDQHCSEHINNSIYDCSDAACIVRTITARHGPTLAQLLASPRFTAG